MTSGLPTNASLSAQIALHNLEMTLEGNEIRHKSNICALEINRIRQERKLNKEKDDEKEIEKKRGKKREKERKKEEKKMKKERKKEAKKMEKENKKMEMEMERENEMGKKGDYKQQASFCWAF